MKEEIKKIISNLDETINYDKKNLLIYKFENDIVELLHILKIFNEDENISAALKKKFTQFKNEISELFDNYISITQAVDENQQIETKYEFIRKNKKFIPRWSKKIKNLILKKLNN